MEFLSFDVESTYDKVNVYHGSNTSGELLGTFSGNSSPGDIISDSPVFIDFRTDFLYTYNGFKIRYTILDHKSGKA